VLDVEIHYGDGQTTICSSNETSSK
jgi:hypothetical protein